MSKKGLTLIELLLASVLVGLVSVSVAGIYGAAQRNMVSSLTISRVHGDAAYAVKHISRRVQNATVVRMMPTTKGGPFSDLEFVWDEMATNNIPNNNPRRYTSRYVLTGDNIQGPLQLDYYQDWTGTYGTPTAELVARNVFPPPSSGGIIFPILQLDANNAFVWIDITVQQTAGGDTRKSRMSTMILPRGIGELTTPPPASP